MIYRPHFTYIEAATPEQKQAREAAANEEWRKRLIFHPIITEWHPVWRIFHPEWHPPRPEPIRITPLPIVRPHPEHEEWRRRLIVQEWHPPRQEYNPPRLHIFPLPIVSPPILRTIRFYEEQNESNSPHGTPIRTPVGTPVHENNSSGHILPSPTVRQEQHEHPIGITVTQPPSRKPLMLPPTHESTHESTPSHGTPVSIPVGTPVRLPSDIHIVPSPVIRSSTYESEPIHALPLPIGSHGVPLMLPPTHETSNTSPPSTNPQQIIDNMISQGVVVGRILSGIEHAEGVSSSPPPQQTSSQTTTHQTVPATIGRTLSAIQQTEGVSTSPPLQQTSPKPQQTSPPPANPQQMIDNMISQGVNLSTQSVETNNPSGLIVANAATSQKSQSSNPLGAFFGSLGSDITSAVKDVGSAVTGALSAANNVIQNTYNSIYGSQTQQEKQQLQNQLNQVQQQAQQELSQINQEKQQLQNELQQVQQYEAQANQMLQQNPGNQQLQSYLQQLQQEQQQIQQGLTQLNQAQQQIQTQEQQAQQQIQQQLTQLNKQGGNPFQQFFNDIADVSALVGYYGTEALGGAGEELAHVAQGKGLENFGQAVSQFNKAGGQNVAKTVGDITEVALPAIATAIVAPELLPAELIGEASSVGLGEAITKITTGKWQSLPQVLQEANEGGVLGAVGEAGGLALESGLAKGAGALTKLLSGSEDLASKVSGLTPVWRAAGGALTNTALQAPFTQNPEQLGIAAAIGGLAGGLGPGVAGKIASKIDEVRGTGGVAELETLKSPLTGETTQAWKITLPSGDTIHLVPKSTFGQGDLESFIDRYTNEVGENNLLAHVTPWRNFIKDVEKGEVVIKPSQSASGDWAWRIPSKNNEFYLSPGEGEHEAVALTGYMGLKGTEPRVPDFRLRQSSVGRVMDRFLHPFDKGGIILTRSDIEVGPTPPRDLVEYIAQLRAKYGGDNNAVIKELLSNPEYGPKYMEFRNMVKEFSAGEGKPVIGSEDLLGLNHERQAILSTGAKLRGTGEEYNVWVRQTPELLENLPGPLRDILSDWSRLKVVGADIIPGEPTDLFNVNKENEGRLRGEREFKEEEKIPELRDEVKEEKIPRLEEEIEEEKIPELQEEEWREGGERVPELREEIEEEKIPELKGEEVELREPILREPLWLEREPQLDDIGSQTYTSPPRVTYPPPPPPRITYPPPPPPPRHIVPPPPPPRHVIPPPPRHVIPPPPPPPPRHVISPPPPPPPRRIVSPPPPPPPPPPSPEPVTEETSPPPPVFSLSSVTQSESGAPLPMGPPPMLPMIMPGGFGGGKNNQEISGMAGEVIYL